MEKKNIYFENNGASIAMRYDMLPTDELDDAALERLKTNIPDGIAMTQYSDVDARRICYAYIPSSVQLSSFLKKQLSKVEVLTVLKNIITSLDIGKFSIPVSYVVKDLDFVYIEEQSLKTFSFMIPIKGQVMEVSEIPDFLRTVVSYMKFREEDTDNYVAKILTCINSDRFSLNDINVMVSEMLLEVGDAMQPAQPQGMAKVDKLGVMRNRVVPPTPQVVQQPMFDPNMQQFGGQPQQYGQPQFDPNMQQYGQPQQYDQSQMRPDMQQYGQPQQYDPNMQQYGQPQQFDPNMQQYGQPQQFDPNMQQYGQPQQYDPNMQQYGQPQQFDPNMQQYGGQPQQFNPNMQQYGGQPQQFDPNMQQYGQPQQFDPNMQQYEQPVQRFDPMTGLPLDTPVQQEPVQEPEAPVAEEPVQEPEAPVAENPVQEPEAPVAEEPVQEPEAPVAEEPVQEPEAPVAEEPVQEPEAPVAEEPVQEPIKRFDPMTGMPLTEESVAPEAVQEPEPVKRFDPMTGMPLAEEAVVPEAEPVKRFDPMTGMPLAEEVAAPEAALVKRFDPMTGLPLTDEVPQEPVVPQEPAPMQEPVAPQGPVFTDGMFTTGPLTSQEPAPTQEPVSPQGPTFPDEIFNDGLLEPVAPEVPQEPQAPVAPEVPQEPVAPEVPQEPVAPEVPQEPAQEEQKQPVQPPQRPDGEMNDEMFNIDDLMKMEPEGDKKTEETPVPEIAPDLSTYESAVADLIKPHFVREKTGEKIYITKDEFKIGKSRIHSDYSIEKNTAISRVHVIVIRRNGVNYLKDNNSTNGTYVDGERLEPGREVLLKNDMKIKFGDEDFTFLLRDE